MPAFVKSTGAAEVFVGVLNATPRITAQGAQSNFTPLFLGTCAVPPSDELRIGWAPIMSDLAGNVLPFDDAFNSAEALIDLDLNRADENVLDLVKNIWPVLGTIPGTWRDTDVGTLHNTEGYGFPVWLRNVRRGVAAMIDSDMHEGIRYYGCRLVSNSHRGGNQDERNHLVLHARAIRSQKVSATHTLGATWQLFDFDMKAVNGLATN